MSVSDKTPQDNAAKPESSSDSSTPDWMRMAASETSGDSPTEENTPDWLKSIQEGREGNPGASASAEDDPLAGMSDLERLLAEEGIDLSSVQDEAPEGSEGLTARDWLIATSDDDMVRRLSSNTPIEQESPAAEPVTAEAETADDPFAGMSDLERLLAEEGIDMSSVQDEAPEGSEGLTARDWLIATSDDDMVRRLSTSAPLEGVSTAPPPPPQAAAPPAQQDDEDPFAGMSDLERLLAEEGVDLSTIEESRPEGSEGLSARDWMISRSDDDMIRKLASSSEELDLTTPPAGGAEGLPDWLEADLEASAIEPEAETAPVTAQQDEADDLPDWLQDVEEETSASTTEAPSFTDTEDDLMVVDDDLPDWLQDVEEETTATSAPVEPEPAAQPDFTFTESQSDPMIVDDDLPDWLQDMEEEDVATSASAMGDTSPDTSGDLPDWLQDEAAASTPAPTEAKAEEPAAEAPPPSAAPKMPSFVDTEDDMMVVEEDLPDWLRDSSEGPLAEEAVAETPSPTTDTKEDIAVVDDDFPDWLQDADESPVPTEAKAEEPAAEAPPPPAAQKIPSFVDTEDDMMVVEEDLPDWLRDSSEPLAEPTAETPSVVEKAEPEGETPSTDEDDLPDWLQDADDDSFGMAETPVAEEAGSITDGDEELPDWLQDVEEEEEEEKSIPTPAPGAPVPPTPAMMEEQEGDMMVVEEDLPDWLRESSEEEETDEEALSAETDIEPLLDSTVSATEDLPDWLREVEDEVDDLSALEASAEEEEEDPLAAEDFPDWLQDVEEEEAVPDFATAEATASTEEGIPDWLRETRENLPSEKDLFEGVLAVEEEQETDAEVAESESMPSWLRDVEEEEEELVVAEEPEPEPIKEPEPEPEPAPVIKEPEPEPEPVIKEPEPEPEPVIKEPEPEPEPVIKEPEPEPDPEPTMPTPPIPTPEIAPQPLSVAAPMGRPVAEPEAVPAIYTGELPAWLQKLREGDRRAREEMQMASFSVPVPRLAPVVVTQYVVPQGGEMAQMAPAAAQPQPQAPDSASQQPQATAPSPTPPAEAEEQLKIARAARTQGDIEQAADAYSAVANTGYFLKEIIADIDDLLASQPGNPELLRAKGDALMRAGRLQMALQTYRQAITKL